MKLLIQPTRSESLLMQSGMYQLHELPVIIRVAQRGAWAFCAHCGTVNVCELTAICKSDEDAIKVLKPWLQAHLDCRPIRGVRKKVLAAIARHKREGAVIDVNEQTIWQD